MRRPGPWRRRDVVAALLATLLSGLVLAGLAGFTVERIWHNDGLDYAQIAREVADGHGMSSRQAIYALHLRFLADHGLLDEPWPNLHRFPLHFTWGLPPLPHGPDLLILATDLAGVGGPELPLEVSAIDSFASVTDGADRTIGIVGRVEVSLASVYLGHQDLLCDVLDRCHEVSAYLLDRAPVWLGE